MSLGAGDTQFFDSPGRRPVQLDVLAHRQGTSSGRRGRHTGVLLALSRWRCASSPPGSPTGPGLTCIVEGLPAGLELDHERPRPRPRPPPARPRPRRADEDRERRRRGHRRRAPRPHARRPDRAPGRQPRLRQLGGADEPVAGRGRGAPRSTSRAPATPTWPACMKYRPHRRAQRARARERARDRGARGRRRRWPRRSCARSASRCSRHVVQIGAVRAPRERDDLRPEDFAGVDESPVRCLDAEARAAMVEEINVLRKANESLGGVFEVRAFGARARARARTCPGRSASTAGSARRAVLDPGHEGRRHRRRLRAGRPPRLARPTTRSSGREERGYYRETNRAGGLEGGMTTGEPLVVRVRDEAAADADQAAALGRHRDAASPRRRCASAPTRPPSPPPAWWGRRWSRSCSPTPTGAKFGGDHIDDVLAAVRAYQRADRVAALSAAARSSSSASWARASRPPRAPWPTRWASTRSTPTRCSRRDVGMPIARLLRRARARRRSASARSESCVELLAARAAGAVVSLGGGALASERVRAALRRPHAWCCSTSTSTPPGGGRAAGAERPLARDRDALRRAARRARGRSTRRAADAVLHRPARDVARRGAARPARAARRGPAGHAAGVGARARSGEYPVLVGRGLLATGFWPRRRGRAGIARQRHRPSVAALHAASLPEAAGELRDRRPARRTRRCAPPSGSGARCARAGVTRDRPRRRARRRRRRRPRPASAPPPTSAGSPSCTCRRPSSPRSTRPTAARPASTCPRPRTTSAPTTSRRPSLVDPATLRHAARRGAARPATPRSSRPR